MKKFNIITSLVFVLGLVGPIAVLAAGPAKINLGTAGNFAILAKTGISTIGTTLVAGDIGVSPAEATYITGFDLILPAASAFSTSALVVGKVYAPSYAVPTPSNISTAVSNMETAYNDGAGRSLNAITELGAGNIGGMTLAPGLYKWGTGVIIPTDVTLSGSSNDVWIFVIAQNLTISSATKIVLAGGAQASNIFWVVAGQTTIGTTAVFNGNILDQTAIILNTGAKLNGRALAQTAVTLDANPVVMPSITIVTPTIPATPAVSTIIPAVPATPVSSSYASYSSYTGSVSPVLTVTTNTSVPATSVLTSKQQQQYDQLISLGVSSVNALNLVNLMPTSASTNASFNSNSALPSASAFGQQVKAIAVNLGQGGRNDNVKVLQQFLISQNKGPAAQALAKNGATTYFGSMTRAALAEFQSKVGISPALGNFGSITRAYISSNY